jgi:alkanesulfonate monooxygenase SsuD/methylene tetrahydromethanopterin reductase-like flavin-dependent oxidoreductase (luciferase family)
VRIGLLLPLFSEDASKPLERARRAEELGFDGAFAFDHLVPLGGPADGPSLEAYSVLAAVAASTERLTLGTLVTRVTLRHAGLLAKQAAGLDEMSDGRFVLAMGTGDEASRIEAESFGFPLPGPDERRRLLEETASACKALFRGEPWTGGDLVPAMTGPLLPPPSTPGGPPVWLGGTSNAVIDMAGRIADGWNGWGLSRERFGAKASRLRDAAAAANRDASPTWAGLTLVARDGAELATMLAERRDRGLGIGDMWSGTAEDLVAFLAALADEGATWAVLMLAGPTDRLDLVGREVVPAVRSGR